MMALADPVLLLAIAVPEWLMLTLFGSEFTAPAPARQIMACGQLLDVLTGPVRSMLVMGRR
jgi:O-antigen/teichoic acid export membrane protein